jgi:hypothetical protein
MKSPPTSSAGKGVVVEVLGCMHWVATHCNSGGGGALSAVRLVGLVVELAVTGASSVVVAHHWCWWW